MLELGGVAGAEDIAAHNECGHVRLKEIVDVVLVHLLVLAKSHARAQQQLPTFEQRSNP